MKLSCLAIIPARYDSVRLPAKALAEIKGKPLVTRVWEQASRAQLPQKVIIATDHARIAEVGRHSGAQVVMTSPDHPSGTDRVAEAVNIVEQEEGLEYELIVNVQGDMPFIHPDVIDQTAQALAQAPANFGISTVAIPIRNPDEIARPSVVKLVQCKNGRALYFSRSIIPFHRSVPVEGSHLGWRHLGLYVFRRDALKRFTTLPSCELEKQERLEQLRALYHGMDILCVPVDPDLMRDSIEIDTPEDLERAQEWCEVNE